MDFLSLPLPVVCEILSKYLCANELAFFDTAICDKSLRSTLVDTIFLDKHFFFWTDEMAVKGECTTNYHSYSIRPFDLRLFLLWLWKRGVLVRKFKFMDFNNLQATSIAYFWERLSPRVVSEMHHFNLERLLEINDDDLQQLCLRCYNTNFLNLAHCSLITNDGIRFIALLKNLCALNVSNCNIGYDVLKYVAKNCVNLTYLWWDMLNGAYVVEPNQALGASLYGLVDVLSECNKELRLLSFQCQEFHSKFSVTPTTIAKIVSSFQLLTVLLLNGTMNFGDDGALVIGRGCPNLKVLGLRKLFGRITDVGVQNIGQGCPQLMELNLSGHTQVYNFSISKLVGKCPRLSRMYLRGTNVSNWVFFNCRGIHFFFGDDHMRPVVDYPSERNGSDEFFDESFKTQF